MKIRVQMTSATFLLLGLIAALSNSSFAQTGQFPIGVVGADGRAIAASNVSQCRALDQQWSAIEKQLEDAHQQCLDTVCKHDRSPYPNHTCSCAGCQSRHDIRHTASKSHSDQSSLCNDQVRAYDRAIADQRRKSEEWARQMQKQQDEAKNAYSVRMPWENKPNVDQEMAKRINDLARDARDVDPRPPYPTAIQAIESYAKDQVIADTQNSFDALNRLGTDLAQFHGEFSSTADDSRGNNGSNSPISRPPGTGANNSSKSVRDRYRGLSDDALRCYDGKMGGVTSRVSKHDAACVSLYALACLGGASTSKDVNAAIYLDTKAGCASFSSTYHNECAACSSRIPGD